MGLNCVENETLEAYKLKIETIAGQLFSGEKRLVIWGAGENGERFKRYCDAIHMPVMCIVDNNPTLWGTMRWETPIISPKELCRLEDAVVLISFPVNSVVQEVAAQIDEMRAAIPYFNDNLFYLLQNTACGRTETAAEVVNSMYKSVNDDEYLHMEMLVSKPITTKCNLKCKYCMLRIPYMELHRDEPAAVILENIERTLEIVDSIKTLDVSGGETFLYSELVSLLNRLKNYPHIFSINVVTNGTLIPDDTVFDAMKNSNIVLKISDYGDMSRKIPEIEEKCREKDIPCFVQSCDWYDLSPQEGLERSAGELQKLFDTCTLKDNCIRNWDGIIYRCGFQGLWSDERVLPHTALIRKDGIDLRDRADDRVLKRRLKEYLASAVPFEICKYCRGNTSPIPRAIQL